MSKPMTAAPIGATRPGVIERLEAVRELVRAVAALVDDGETSMVAGELVTTVTQAGVAAVEQALEAVEALIPPEEEPAGPGHLLTMVIDDIHNTETWAAKALKPFAQVAHEHDGPRASKVEAWLAVRQPLGVETFLQLEDFRAARVVLGGLDNALIYRDLP